MYKAIIFDLDDTLIETYKTIWHCYKETARQFYNVEITDDQLRKVWGRPASEIFQELLLIHEPTGDHDVVEKNYSSIRNNFVIQAFPKYPKLIENLSQKYTLGIITSSKRNRFYHTLEQIGYPPERFAFIQADGDYEYFKPDVRVFDIAFPLLTSKNINREEIVFVGDSLIDMQAANNAGIKFIGVTTGVITKEEFIANGVKEEFIVENLLKLEELLI